MKRWLLVALLVLVVAVPAFGSPRIKATSLFPYEVTQIGDLQEPLCETEVIGESCEAGESTTKTEDIDFSGEQVYNGTVEYSGTTPYTYKSFVFEGTACMDLIGVANECPSNGRKENCCERQGNNNFSLLGTPQQYHWVCYGYNPTVGEFCYPKYIELENTVQVPYSGTKDYSGSVKYSGSVPFTYTTAGDVIFTPGQAVTTCENVGIEQLIVTACQGETITVRGTGYIWREKPHDTVKSRFAIFHQAPGKSKKVMIVNEDKSLADVVDGEFREERQVTLDRVGTYTIRFWLYNKGTPVSLAKERIIEVVEGCEPKVME